MKGSIDYNKDNSNTIDFKITKDNLDVIDSTTQDKKYGLEIKMIDNETSKTLDKTYLSNIQFKYNDKVYMPYTNGIINVNLEKITSQLLPSGYLILTIFSSLCGNS